MFKLFKLLHLRKGGMYKGKEESDERKKRWRKLREMEMKRRREERRRQGRDAQIDIQMERPEDVLIDLLTESLTH